MKDGICKEIVEKTLLHSAKNAEMNSRCPHAVDGNINVIHLGNFPGLRSCLSILFISVDAWQNVSFIFKYATM